MRKYSDTYTKYWVIFCHFPVFVVIQQESFDAKNSSNFKCCRFQFFPVFDKIGLICQDIMAGGLIRLSAFADILH